MPKITVHGGATNKAEYVEPVEEEVEEPLAGSNTSTSSSKPQTTEETPEFMGLLPAPTMGNPFEKDQTESSTVDTTDGNQPDETDKQ